MTSKAKVIIDTDCGVDDAQAILIALSEEFSDRIDVVGITCCSGNVLVDQVAINVLKVLAAAERLDIPVYKGACSPLLRKYLNKIIVCLLNESILSISYLGQVCNVESFGAINHDILIYFSSRVSAYLFISQFNEVTK